MSVIAVTNIYSEFWGTEQFRASCAMVGIPIYNAYKGGGFTGNGTVLNALHDAYYFLKDTVDLAVYCDGGDTFFQKPIDVPKDRIIWSTEKQVWPRLPELIQKYDNYYNDLMNFKYTPWMFLNGGNCCGPTYLLWEFYSRYGLNLYNGQDVNGQKELSEAYLTAKKEGFPIYLDTQCEYFQTTAFAETNEFALAEDGKGIINVYTGTYPSVLHGNGRTDMKPIYERFNLVNVSTRRTQNNGRLRGRAL
jgi:hypothetical protein